MANISQSYTPGINYLEVAFSPTNEINEEVLEHYSKYGYERTHNHIRKLLFEDKISLNMKSNLMDKINRLQLMTRSQRKKLYNI